MGDYRILIVEDDMAIANEVSSHLKTWGFNIETVKDFSNVLKEVTEYNPHLVILDIGLPFFNGFYWCQKIREHMTLPTIFLSSASDNMNQVMAINMGGDDFIAKPFDITFLVAKINALLRRSYVFSESQEILEHRDAFLNTGDSTLTYKGERIELTKNEYRILYTLLRNKGKVVSRESLMENLWQSDLFVDDNTLTVNINRLRKKLDDAGLTEFILTKHKKGYIIE